MQGQAQQADTQAVVKEHRNTMCVSGMLQLLWLL
jgi:hypothetical protein